MVDAAQVHASYALHIYLTPVSKTGEGKEVSLLHFAIFVQGAR